MANKVYRSMDGFYHEYFSGYTPALDMNFKEHHEIECRPGFWYTVDKNGDLIRCGCARDMKYAMNKFEKQPGEEKIYLRWSTKNGEEGFLDMKDFKQQFRRHIKT